MALSARKQVGLGHRLVTVSFDGETADRWRRVCVESPEEFRSFRAFLIAMIERGIAAPANPPKETP